MDFTHTQALKRIEAKLDLLLKNQGVVMFDLTALQTAVTNDTTVDGSVETLLTQLTAQISTLIANSGNTVDPVALQAIVTQINANAATLSAAVVANTPVSTPA